MSKVVLAKRQPEAYDSYPKDVKEAVDALIQNGLPAKYKNIFKPGKITLNSLPKDFFTNKDYENAVIALVDNLEVFVNNGIAFNNAILDNLEPYNSADFEKAKAFTKEVEKDEARGRKNKKIQDAIAAATGPLKQQLESKDEEIKRLQNEVNEKLEEYKKASNEEKDKILKRTNELLEQAKKDGDERARKVLEDAKKAMTFMDKRYKEVIDETKKLIPPRVLSNQEKHALYNSYQPLIDKAAREHIPDDNLKHFFKERGNIENPELVKSLAQVVRQREAGMLGNRMINERILNKPELLETLTAPMKDEYFKNVPQFRQPRPQDLPLPIQNENWGERAPIPKHWLTRRMYWQVKNM